ncbi:hypothetical protein M3193_13670 [Sporosarcina luteola]|uniref:hypothetical protein n=1 Tax=Sporosarcina luteola TaxID=582850 RepID=UPI00203C988B|nr:hypothetical protein [Sporosarcina luteola]MCM3745183.1 hypothetical protein [Sporosarcina luteola]
MEIIVSVVLLLLFGYVLFKFYRLKSKLKQAVVFPVTEEDLKAMRAQPKKALDLPVVASLLRGICALGLLFLFFIITVIYDLYDSEVVGWNLYAMFIVPLMIFNPAWNLFAIVEDGVICEGRFVPWNSIRSYQIEEVHSNHPVYTPGVSNAYVLKIHRKRKYFIISCFITTDAVIEKLIGLLDARLS